MCQFYSEFYCYKGLKLITITQNFPKRSPSVILSPHRTLLVDPSGHCFIKTLALPKLCLCGYAWIWNMKRISVRVVQYEYLYLCYGCWVTFGAVKIWEVFSRHIYIEDFPGSSVVFMALQPSYLVFFAVHHLVIRRMFGVTRNKCFSIYATLVVVGEWILRLTNMIGEFFSMSESIWRNKFLVAPVSMTLAVFYIVVSSRVFSVVSTTSSSYL
jgi:hypothetical protein